MPQTLTMHDNDVINVMHTALQKKEANGPFFTLVFPSYDVAQQCAEHLRKVNILKEAPGIRSAKPQNKEYIAGGSVFNLHGSRIAEIEQYYQKSFEALQKANPVLENELAEQRLEIKDARADGPNGKELINIMEAALSQAKPQGDFFVAVFTSKKIADRAAEHLREIGLLKQAPNVHPARAPFQQDAPAGAYILNVHKSRRDEFVATYSSLKAAPEKEIQGQNLPQAPGGPR